MSKAERYEDLLNLEVEQNDEQQIDILSSEKWKFENTNGKFNNFSIRINEEGKSGLAQKNKKVEKVS